MPYLTLGLRNLIKHARKTILTLLTVSLGFACLLLAKGYTNYCLWGLRESIINGGVGHFQIHASGYADRNGDDDIRLIYGYRAALRELSLVPGVLFVAPRLSLTGLLTGRESTAIVVGHGGRYREEDKLMAFSTVDRGDGKSGDEAENIEELQVRNVPASGAANGILIGRGVADTTGLSVGDDCVLSVATSSGAVNAMDFTVTGIVSTQLEEMENAFACVALDTAQDLLGTPESIDTLIVMLTDTDAVAATAPIIRETCARHGLEYRVWNEIVPYYEGASEFYSSAMNVALVVILSVVVFAVANTTLMSFYDRMREIGAMRAVGMNAAQTVRLVGTESLLIGIGGCLAGITLALTVACAVNAAGGIPLPPPPGNTRAYRGLIFVERLDALLYSVLFACVALAASLVPARKAVRISISDTLRWI